MSNVKTTKCSGCQQTYRVPVSKEGKTATCKKCGQKFKIQFEDTPAPAKSTKEKTAKPDTSKPKAASQPVKEAPKEAPDTTDTPQEESAANDVTPEESIANDATSEESPESNNNDNYDAITDASTSDVASNTEESENKPEDSESPKTDEPPPPPKEKKKMLEYDTGYRPLDPDTLMESLDIVVSEDKLQAHLVVKKPLDRDTTYKDIHFFLADKKVLFGVVDEDKIKNFLKKKLLHNRPWLVAEGKPPEEPTDGEVNYLFDIDPLKRPVVPEEGESKERVDFKDRGEMPYVKAGDLVAERKPGLPGVQGMDVYGAQIKTRKAKQATLRVGEGVELSYDKRLANSKIDGMPVLQVERNQEKVIVVPEYFIKGDVNMKTGNVRFKGPVVVKGTVENGFKVISASLVANEIMKASIDVEGDVIVAGGIIGANITSKGKVEAKFIKGAVIDSMTNVSAPQGIIDSKVYTSGECIVEKGKILNSEVCAYLGITTRDIGSFTSPESTLTIGIDPALLKQVTQLETDIAEKKKALEKFKEENKVPEDIAEQLEQLNSKITPLQESVEKTEAIRPSLAQKLEAAKKKGNKKELQLTIKTVKEIETKFQSAKENLEKLKQEREKLEGELGDLPQMEKELTELQAKLDEVKGLIADDRQSAPIKVSGTVYRNTIIKGVHAKHEIKDDEKKVVIQEIYKVDEEDKVESVIITESLKEKEKSK
jgi:hypothetical protein